jgi:DNA-binding NarL/FixJ family response regulator
VLAALRSCVQTGPVLIAIDDVQWLDTESLAALAFALRRVTTGPLSVLLAARAEAPADPLTVGAPPPPRGWRDLLAALPAAEEIMLGPLDARQVQSLLPRAVSAAQVRLVTQQSRGNPFWAEEIWAAPGSAETPVPPLARALTERLSRSLTPAAAEALATVAAAGRIPVPDVLAVLGHLQDPAAALDAAVLAGVVAETGGRVTAAHPLIGAAAVESLPPARRAQLYHRLAAATSNPERYAHFAALAAGPGPGPAVADALDAAAAAAHARAANSAAAGFAAKAVAYTPASDSAALVRRRIRAGELLFLAGDVDRSLEQLEALDTVARFFGACVRGKVSAWRGDAAATVRHLELAAKLADESDRDDPGVRYRLDPLLAEAYVTVGRQAEASRISAWLREVGLRQDRPALIGDASRVDALASAMTGDLDAAAESARAAVAAHGLSPLRPELAGSLLALGRIERRRKARRESRAALQRALNLAAEMGHQPLLAQIEQELPRAVAARSSAALTEAEQLVAGQIAGGATNREAATALFISVRTVETHVASINRKLGVHTRSELRRVLSGRSGS